MKVMTALLALMFVASAFAQSLPPRPGTTGNTISANGTLNNDPVPTPGRRRNEWNPTPTPTPIPTPRPTPTPRPERDPRYDRRSDRYEPRPETHRSANRIYRGDFIIYNGVEYEVLGVANGTVEVRTPFANERYFVPLANVARTVGCASTYEGRVCVGDMTVGLNDIYYLVIGIEWNGSVVVQTTDRTRTVYGQIDPNSLRVVRN